MGRILSRRELIETRGKYTKLPAGHQAAAPKGPRED